jgi:hypothetical protein
MKYSAEDDDDRYNSLSAVVFVELLLHCLEFNLSYGGFYGL